MLFLQLEKLRLNIAQHFKAVVRVNWISEPVNFSRKPKKLHFETKSQKFRKIKFLSKVKNVFIWIFQTRNGFPAIFSRFGQAIICTTLKYCIFPKKKYVIFCGTKCSCCSFARRIEYRFLYSLLICVIIHWRTHQSHWIS